MKKTPILDGIEHVLEKHSHKVSVALGLLFFGCGVWNAHAAIELAPFATLKANYLFSAAAGAIGSAWLSYNIFYNRRHERRHAALR